MIGYFRGIYTAFSYIVFISLIISYVTEPPSPYIYIIGKGAIVLGKMFENKQTIFKQRYLLKKT